VPSKAGSSAYDYGFLGLTLIGGAFAAATYKGPAQGMGGAAPPPKAAAASAGAATGDNTKETAAWIAKWRKNMAAGGKAAPAAKEAMAPNAMDAAAWIQAWKNKMGKK